MRIAAAFGLLALLSIHCAAAPPHAELRRAGAAPPEVVRWFAALDGLLDDYRRAMQAWSSGNGPLAAKAGAAAAAAASSMAGGYQSVTGDAAAAAKVRAAAREIQAALDGAGEPSRELLAKTLSLAKGSLNRWVQLMRQEALAQPGPRGRFPANSLLTYQDESGRHELAFLDVSAGGLVKDGRIVSPALAALLEALRAAPDTGGTFVVSGRRLWIRRGAADVFVDQGAIANDGQIRFRYLEEDGTFLGQSRFYFLTRALIDCGYSVSVQGGELVASLSGDRVGLDAFTRLERFAAAWRALDTAHRLRPYLGRYLDGTISQDENAQRIDELAGIFAAEGRLPFLDDGGPDRLRLGVMEFRAKNAARETLRAEMNGTLARFRLGVFPDRVLVGQRTIDLYYNAPIDAALARGELMRAKEKLVLDKGYDPLGRLARTGAGGDAPAYAAARCIGTVGGAVARLLQRRGQGGEWETAYQLRRRPASVAGQSYVFDAEVLYAGAAAAAATARITYDRKEALAGGKVFVTPFLTAADAGLLAKSAAVVTTGGGAQTELMARSAGITALNLPQAEWSPSSGLALELPVYGGDRWVAGKKVRPVVRYDRLILQEGDQVRLDAQAGLLVVLDEPQ
ncbi:MAG: hypothetical protein ABIJ96_13430 [Elusimicrobiota bacterium]